jgi:hypothetical protein
MLRELQLTPVDDIVSAPLERFPKCDTFGGAFR